MSKVSILDCTLRDGGYVNDWQFGKSTIKGIVSKLVESNVEIVECGFLRDVLYKEDLSVFSCVSQIAPMIEPKQDNVLYVAMIALGDISPEKILPCDRTSIDGIRLTFHKQDWLQAKSAATLLMQKGYKVFVQPVGTTSYSDEELLHLVKEVNELRPFAFYLVDTLGILYQNDLLRLFHLVDHNLDSGVQIGFHSHNNLQLSFSNAQELLRLNAKRKIILDASVYGMGRGVGNLSTELLAEYINANVEQRYNIMPLLAIADRYLMNIYAEQHWGYALPYFLSAVEGCHPNYAAYLMGKETLNIESISKILSLIPEKQRNLYQSELIENLYLQFQSCKIDDEKSIDYIRGIVQKKSVMILGPGSSLESHKRQIEEFIKNNNAIIVPINFIPPNLKTDILFVSNRKRLENLKDALQEQSCIIATSNLQKDLTGNVVFVDYSSFLGEGKGADNAGAMLIRVLKKSGVKEIALAGLDGFDSDSSRNYCIDAYKNAIDRETAEEKNRDISRQLRQALADIPHKFITPTRYDIK